MPDCQRRGSITDTAPSATLISTPPAAAPGPTAEDIRKVIAEHKAREARKDKDKEKDKDKDKPEQDAKDAKPKAPAPPTSPSPVPVASPPPSHRKYALHRAMFEMRRTELRRKDQAGKAKEVSRGKWWSESGGVGRG